MCVELLSRFVAELGLDRASRDGALAYKFDESADWEEWWDQTGLSFSRLTGRDAPHYFRVGLRRDLGETVSSATGCHGGEEELSVTCTELDHLKSGEDVMLVVKARMASLRVAQVACLLPAARRARMERLPQPRGHHPRRAGGGAVKAKMARVAEELSAERVISEEARAYLVEWATGLRVRQPRPLRYNFLDHRWAERPAGAAREALTHDGGSGELRVVRVRLLGVHGAPLPEDPEEEEDAAELVEVSEL